MVKLYFIQENQNQLMLTFEAKVMHNPLKQNEYQSQQVPKRRKEKVAINSAESGNTGIVIQTSNLLCSAICGEEKMPS